MKLIATILSGGSGSRLWPVSREMHPKPFIRLADGQSFIQKSFLRAAALPQVTEILTVTNRELLFITKDEYRALNSNMRSQFLLEPVARNTAAAVVMAALKVKHNHGPEALVLILTADHLIHQQAAFQQAVETACKIAQTGKIVTFGIQPNAPETGYGYIEADLHQAILAENNQTAYQQTAFKVARFVEKPDQTTAQQYLDSGKFYWNSGMFCFSAQTLLDEMQLHAPDILASASACFTQSLTLNKDESQIELDKASFTSIPSNSIDYAIMEKSSKVAVIPCDMGWTDVGAWDAMSELTPQDQAGNRIEGEAMLIDSHNCYVKSDKRLIAVLGLDNVIVVDTPDALLIADKQQTQQVKDIYNTLKTKGNEAYKLHKTVHRPWGTYTTLEEGPRFKIKRIVVKPGASLSLQMHHHRSEHWVVVTGAAKVTNGDQSFTVNPNESTFIPAGCKHKLENPGLLDLVMIEVQCGDYVGEDDIVRFSHHLAQ